uniref:ADF-H domain-containing protein n=1 Tax=Glossina pallidipes TaxID=7398 RepID=A0A1A9ZDZ7_GLOPL
MFGIMWIGILFFLTTTALTVAEKRETKSKTKVSTTKAASTSKTLEKTSKPTEASSTSARTTTKTLKSAKSLDSRGKRTLYDFGNAGFLYPQVAARRAGYSAEPRTSYYPTNSGYFNGENAIAQFPSSPYAAYPQYLEAPEPIIEIIIKDSNDTLGSTQPAHPVATKTKKKKEKVHVYYVNYKKDANNKLHLESPIASLNNNDDNEEEEVEEEVVHYPTPLPQVQTTTLRTIIHPDSEKYHSNSGIHVTFGSEDKSHVGQILEEHDAESVQREVVALPATPQIGHNNPSYNNGLNYQQFAQTRSNQGGNYYFNNPIAPGPPPAASAYFSQQQLPNQHGSNYFRPPHQPLKPQSAPNTQQYYQKPAVAQTPLRPGYNAVNKPLANAHQQQAAQQPHYYVNFNQQYHQVPTQSQSQYYNGFGQKPAQSAKPSASAIFFPTVPPKGQELPSRHSPAPYQPVKFRPTPAPVPIYSKATYKPFTYQKQPQYTQQQQHSSFNFGSANPLQQQQANYYKTQTQLQHPIQPQAQHQTQPQPPLNHLQTQPLNNHNNALYYSQKQQKQQQQQQQHQQQQQQQHQVQAQFQNKYHSGPGAASSASPSLTPAGQHYQNHNPLGLLKETELLQSIPKFEQHITETVQQQYKPNGYQSQNQVIHDIPAPNLNPNQQQQKDQSQNSYSGNQNSYNQQHNHQASQSQQFSNFVTSSSFKNSPVTKSYPAVTQAPQRNPHHTQYQPDSYKSTKHAPSPTTQTPSTSQQSTTPNPKTLIQLPDEVPDDLRQQLLSSGILNNADISVLDYDKIGETALENLPPEHLQHFYGGGGGAQISESKKVLTVLKPNGDKVKINEKGLERVKETNSLHLKSPTSEVKLVKDGEDVSSSSERQYNRYLPLKINGAQFPKPENDELKDRKILSVVVLAPVESSTPASTEEGKEVKFLGGDLIKTLVKKPTKDNFKRWLEKESRTDVDQQAVILLVTKDDSSGAEQEIFMYDIASGVVNKLNGELSSTFVNVAEENASSEDLEHASTLDPSILENVMQKIQR